MLADHPLHDAGDLEVRVDRNPHPRQVSGRVEGRYELLQIVERHRTSIGGYPGDMYIRLGTIVAVVALVLWLFAMFDVLTTPANRVRGLPKFVWLVIVVAFMGIGALAWFALGRPRVGVTAPAARAHPSGGLELPRWRATPPVRGVAPDDDPDFLRRLSEDLRRGQDPRRGPDDAP